MHSQGIVRTLKMETANLTMEILWLLYSAFTSILPTGNQDLETKDMKYFLIQIRRAGIITNESVNYEGTSWSHSLKSVQKTICRWTDDHLPLPTQKKHKHGLTQLGNSDFENLGNLLREDNKTRSLMRNRTPQANFHISQDWAEFWMHSHTSFQWLELTIPPLYCVSFLDQHAIWKICCISAKPPMF